MRRRTDPYHLLVAQNFLANISRDGSHQDTALRIFAQPGVEVANVVDDALAAVKVADVTGLSETSCLHAEGLQNMLVDDEGPSNEAVMASFADADGPSVNLPCRRHSWQTDDNSPRSSKKISMVFSGTPPKKPSIFKRLVTIVNLEDSLGRLKDRDADEGRAKSARDQTEKERLAVGNEEDRPSSPMSPSHFSFLKRLRHSLARGERSLLCSESSSNPLLVISYFPFVSDRPKRMRRSRSTMAVGMERLRYSSQCSIDELRPFDLKEGEHVSFAYFFGSPCVTSRRIHVRRESSHINRHSIDFDDKGSIRESTTEVVESAILESRDEIAWDEQTVAGESYDPLALDEVDAARKTVIRVNGFLGTTLQFANDDTMKNGLNQRFIDKYPHIQLSYSKFKSLKRELHDLVVDCDVDVLTHAQAITYFERVVLKGLITKTNRKLVLGASLLVAVKLNDYNKSQIKNIIDHLEEQLRVSRRDLLGLELPLCVALDFDLLARPRQLLPHYNKLVFLMSP